MAERDYPIGHPAASDYKGEPYTDPHALFHVDYPVGHPARHGKNSGLLDTPDGMREAQNQCTQNLVDLAGVGSLPALLDPDTQEPINLSPAELAHVYAVRNSLSPAKADDITAAYGLDPRQPNAAQAVLATMTPEEQALQILIRRGYSPERAQEIMDRYGAPDTLAQH